MEQYMLFFAIDGTLWDEETGQIPESAVRALRQAKANGHLLFICTGRCKAIWPQEVLDIGFDGVIGGCGTHIYYHGEELLHATLESELQQEIAEDIIRFNIDGVLEGPEESYFRKDLWMPVVKNIYQSNGTFSCKSNLFLEDVDELNFDKMALWYDDTSDMAAFKAKYQDRFEFIERDPTFYELVPKGYSKATGIEFMCQYLNVNRKFTVGVGDSTNDLPMLDYVEFSVAMGSGNPDVFPFVDYVTSAVMEDGIEKALKFYKII